MIPARWRPKLIAAFRATGLDKELEKNAMSLDDFFDRLYLGTYCETVDAAEARIRQMDEALRRDGFLETENSKSERGSLGDDGAAQGQGSLSEKGDKDYRNGLT